MTNETNSKPVIVAFVNDFMTENKIENVANHLSYRLEIIGDAAAVAPPESDIPQNQAAEPVYGRQANLLEKITHWQPKLLIFDLGNANIPWRQWIATLKSSPATRRIPVLCFGPHVNVEVMTGAKDAGADEVVGRSRFMSAMPDLITKLARSWDYEAITTACREPLSALGIKGIEEFNKGEYFECHEFLEDAWNEDEGPARDMYKAVLQVAVAYLQIERQNYAGAVKMFMRARQWLDPLPDVCRGIDIGRLKQDAQQVHQTLLELGPQQIQTIDRNIFRPVRLVDGS
jgi:predicted metal-dependent hydrolase